MPRKNYISIKASDKEKASWIAQAYLEGKNLSTFIRDRINNAISNAKIEDLRKSIKELVESTSREKESNK